MKVIQYDEYGSPDVLRLKQIDKPLPKENEVLIRIHAVSVNSWDWDLLTGRPYIYRLFFGLFKPRYPVIGSDIAGIVEATGTKVTKFKPGDAVFGDVSAAGWGGFAEYATAPENTLIHKPANMTFEQAAALPQAGTLALQGVKDYGKVQSGQHVLINGAGGGMGTFAIQLAKFYGAIVTAVDSVEKFEIMRSVGADYVIDYKETDFTREDKKYDLILDASAWHSIFDYRRVLKKDGRYVIVGGSVLVILQILFLGLPLSLFSSKKMQILAHKPNQDMHVLTELFESGQLTPIIDKCYHLEDTAKALAHIGAGKAKGKIVVKTDAL